MRFEQYSDQTECTLVRLYRRRGNPMKTRKWEAMAAAAVAYALLILPMTRVRAQGRPATPRAPQAVPGVPALPALPGTPAPPALPALPAMPEMPAMPAVPAL